MLLQHFVERFADEQGKETREVGPEVLSAFERYAFPGNVRELENLVERPSRRPRGSPRRSPRREAGRQSWSGRCGSGCSGRPR